MQLIYICKHIGYSNLRQANASHTCICLCMGDHELFKISKKILKIHFCQRYDCMHKGHITHVYTLKLQCTFNYKMMERILIGEYYIKGLLMDKE